MDDPKNVIYDHNMFMIQATGEPYHKGTNESYILALWLITHPFHKNDLKKLFECHPRRVFEFNNKTNKISKKSFSFFQTFPRLLP
jgi:hypothetical protein